jgi:unsaturated rhamnogalacturonyl hydrolase
MRRFDTAVRVLVLAGSCVSACSLDDRSFVDGEPSQNVEGQGGTAGTSGAQTGNGGVSPDTNGMSRSPGEGPNVDGLVGNGAGGTSMAVTGSGTGGSSAGSAGTDVEVIPAAVDKFFVDWPPGTDPLTVGTRAAEIFTSLSLASGSGHDNTDEYKHYKDACAWYGSLAVAQLGGQQSLINSLIAKYQPYEGTWAAFDPPTTQNAFVGSLDDSLFGIVPLEIAKFSSNPIYAQEGDLAADHQVVFIAQQLRNASDDMFHVAALQMQAYRVSSDPVDRQRHLDTAADTMVAYLQAMQKNSGLIPHHLNQPGFDISWSRGNGWFAAGLAELIREIPSSHPDYVTITSGYRRMMGGLLQYQIPAGQPGAGLWNQVVDSADPRNWVETSGSAMFAYALITGVRKGLLDVEAYGPAARAAWLGLVAQLNATGQIQNVSDWLYLPSSHGYPPEQYAGDEENYYFERGRLTGDNHGQSPLMWSAAALLRPLD